MKEVTEKDVIRIENELRKYGFNAEEIIKMWLIDEARYIMLIFAEIPSAILESIKSWNVYSSSEFFK